MMRYVILFAFFTVALAGASGQQNVDVGCPITQKIQPDGSVQAVDCKGHVVIQQVTAAIAPPNSQPSVGPKPDIKLAENDPAAIAYKKYLEAYYNYQAHSLSYAESVFDWQYKSSIVIFILVVLLVLSGLAFAGIQFAIAMRAHRSGITVPSDVTTRPVAGDDNSSSLASTLDLSPQGVKVTSSVIGLLILVVSIGFFYLYLVYVYPIQNIAK